MSTLELSRTHQFIQRCLDRSPNSIPSLLMMAQNNLHQGNPKLSMQSLEQVLSRHFEVQSFPLYHLVRAMVMRAQENMAQAVASLKTATSLLTSSSKKQSPSLSIFSSSSSLLPPLTLGERDFTVKVFLCGDYDFYSKMHGLPGASASCHEWDLKPAYLYQRVSSYTFTTYSAQLQSLQIDKAKLDVAKHSKETTEQLATYMGSLAGESNYTKTGRSKLKKKGVSRKTCKI
eukprot:Em0007g235a